MRRHSTTYSRHTVESLLVFLSYKLSTNDTQRQTLVLELQREQKELRISQFHANVALTLGDVSSSEVAVQPPRQWSFPASATLLVSHGHYNWVPTKSALGHVDLVLRKISPPCSLYMSILGTCSAPAFRIASKLASTVR